MRYSLSLGTDLHGAILRGAVLNEVPSNIPRRALKTARMILRGSRIRLTMSPMKDPTLMTEKNMKPKNIRAATIIPTKIHIPLQYH